jgi:hypothetical protein
MSKLNKTITLELLMKSELIQQSVKEQIKEETIKGGKYGIDFLNKPFNIVSTQTIKTKKAQKFNEVQAILYLSPANLVAVTTLCNGAKSSGCLKDCLYASGLLGFDSSQWAQVKRTIWYLLYPELFYKLVVKELTRLYKKHGDSLSVRLNGTSDVSWLIIREAMPLLKFYDYTKDFKILKEENKTYDVTFSASAFRPSTIARAKEALKQGHRLAVPVNSKDTKGEWQAKPLTDNLIVHDFDASDLRRNDPKKIIGKLSRKRSSIAERKLLEHSTTPSFFFKEAQYLDLINYAKGL